MKDYFCEFLFVLSFSRKTQYAIILGAVGYVLINLVGNYQLHNFHLTEYLEPLSDVVKDKLIGKYDKAAQGCLVSFWLLAIKQYRKDKKRLYSW
jgi:hypothetical protein